MFRLPVWVWLVSALIIGVAAGESRKGGLSLRAFGDAVPPPDLAIEFDRTDSGWRFARESSYPDSKTTRSAGVVYIRPSCYYTPAPKNWWQRPTSTFEIAPLYEQWAVEYHITNAERFGNVATAQDLQDLMSAATKHLSSHHANEPWASIFRTNQYAYRLYWPGIGYNALALLQLICLLIMAAALIRFIIATRAEVIARNRCLNCDYPLAGLRDPVCPECGTVVTLQS